MSETTSMTEPFYVCAGICRVNPETNRCIGCGRPWEMSATPVTEFPAREARPGTAPTD